MEGGYSSLLPDIFHPNITTQNPAAVMTSSKKEEIFDFISARLLSASSLYLFIYLFIIIIVLFSSMD